MEKNFAITPSVSINRSKFLRTSNHKTSFNLGDIVPIYLDEVLPGDTRSIDVASLVRMSTPIAPIMDDIELEIFAFFVPNRIVWDDWREFMGESPTAGYHAWDGEYPYAVIAGEDLTVKSVGSYFGIGYFDLSGDGNTINISALPLRGYLSIYNRWFRDQNVEGPCFVDSSDGLDVSTDSAGNGYFYDSDCLKAYKKSDYFTRALPYAQKGAPVSLPLGTTAPIILASGTHQTLVKKADGTSYLSPEGEDLQMYSGIGENSFLSNGDYSQALRIDPNGGLLADLRSATAATINQLREAFQLQKLLEKDALYGTRYWELLYGHFGVRSPDATLQDPEYLGGTKMMINVDQVLQTTGSDVSTPANNKLGTPGANSVTGNKGSLFTKSFVEHGFIHIYAVARQRQHTYGQGINRMWRRFDRYDYYWPEFANLGAQEIKTWELLPKFDADSGELIDDTFGYQEAWADYRYKPSIVSGVLNPAFSGSLNFWTLADKFASTPTIGQTFLKETRANLERALVTGHNGPDFIADFYFRDVAVRPMPLYSIPGLIDHH